LLVSPPEPSLERPAALTLIIEKVWRLRAFTEEVTKTIGSFCITSYQGQIQAQFSGYYSFAAMVWIFRNRVDSSWDGLGRGRFHALFDASIASSTARFGYRSLTFIQFPAPLRTMNLSHSNSVLRHPDQLSYI
jgi:hypothetical protein